MKRNNLQLFKTLGILFALPVVLIHFAAVAMAASYPSKPIRLVVPYMPGGAGSNIGRLIGAKLTERLGKQVIIDNRGGGGTIIGTEMVAKADPDGYTLLITSPTHTVQPALQKLPYDPMKSFTPIVRLITGVNTLVVHPSIPANSVEEFITLAKQKAGQLICSCSGTGGVQHVGIELFKIMTDTDFKIVQFKGGGPGMIDLLGGHSQFSLLQLMTALPHIKSGKLKLLGTGGAKRSVIMPNVPTIAEAGVPGYESTQWWGILAPGGTPASIVDRLNNELKAILTADEEVKNWFLKEGSEVDYLGPTEFGLFLAKDMAKWARVVKKANIKLE